MFGPRWRLPESDDLVPVEEHVDDCEDNRDHHKNYVVQGYLPVHSPVPPVSAPEGVLRVLAHGTLL